MGMVEGRLCLTSVQQQADGEFHVRNQKASLSPDFHTVCQPQWESTQPTCSLLASILGSKNTRRPSFSETKSRDSPFLIAREARGSTGEQSLSCIRSMTSPASCLSACRPRHLLGPSQVPESERSWEMEGGRGGLSHFISSTKAALMARQSTHQFLVFRRL